MARRSDVRAIRAIMTPNPLTVRSDTTIERLRQLFETHDFNMFPVLDEKGVLRGVVTKLDVLKIYRPWSGRFTVNVRVLWAEHVEDIMSRGLTSVTPEEPVTTALTLMVNRRHRSIPVVQRRTRRPLLVGIVSRKDVLRSLPFGDSSGPA